MGSSLTLCLGETVIYIRSRFRYRQSKIPSKDCRLIQNPFADWQMIKLDYFHAEPQQNKTELSGTK